MRRQHFAYLKLGGNNLYNIFQNDIQKFHTDKGKKIKLPKTPRDSAAG